MKGQRLHFLFLLSLLCGSIWAQNVVVSGAVSGNGSYPDLGSAFNAINGGVQTGAIILVNIVGNTTESATATLNQGAWSYVYITPSGGAARTVTGNIVGALVQFNGADRVAIDGLNSAGNALTISNTATGAASTVQFVNDARAVGVQKCTLLGSGTSATGGTVFLSTGNGVTGGNDSIAISQCTIAEAGANIPINAIYSAGTATAGQENSQVTVSNCNISNYFSAGSVSVGLFAAAGNTDWTIQGNRFFQTAARTYTTGNTHSAITISSGNNHQITGNIIGFATSAGTGTYTMGGTIATRFIGINLSVGTTTASSVQGNTVTGISLATSSGATTTNGILCGISVTAGNVNIGNVSGNVIGGTVGTSLLTATTTTGGGTMVGIHCGSPGTVLIQNNSIGGLTTLGSTAAIGSGVVGIMVSGNAAQLTIQGNTIGNATADNMRGGTLATTTGSSPVSGIQIAGMPTTGSITQNIIRNLASYGTGTTTTAFVRGIHTLASTVVTTGISITDNQISNLVTNSGNASIANALSAANGIAISAGTNMVVDNNQISAISCLNAGVVSTSLYALTHGNATNSTFSRNRVFGLANASTQTSVTAPPVIGGMLVRSGTNGLTIKNNMFALGSGQATNTAIVGIQTNHGSTPNPTVVSVFHNTVHIEGTVTSGALNSFGFVRTDWGAVARTVPVDIRNNIFSNTRTGGTGQHFAIANNFGATPSATGWGASASNNNVLNANSGTVGWWGSALAFCAWKSTTSCDVNSYSGVPVTFVNSANDLHLNMGTSPNALESSGQLISSVLNDYDNHTRPGPVGSVNGGASAPDLGADEFDGVIGDFSGPAISYTPLPFICVTTDRTLTANITDLTGVPTSGGFVPRVYYRKNAGAWQSAQGSLVSGTGQNGTWNFVLSSAAMGGLTLGDVVSYYVLAQDLATPTFNMNNQPAGCIVATDVNTVTTPPTAVNTYSIGSNMSGTYTVGTTGNYPTLTAAANAYNVGCLTSAVTFSLIDASYPSETYPITITNNPYSSSTNTLLVKPTLANTVISGSSATMLLHLSGADYVTIDGSIGSTVNSCCPYSAASRDLTLNNTNTGVNSGVIWMGTTASNDAVTNCTVQNTVLQGSGSATTLIGVGAGGSSVGLAGTANDNLAIVNNDIRACQVGIYSAGISPTTKNNTINVSMNLLNAASPNNIGWQGIYVAYTDQVNVSCNQIDNINNSGSFDVAGINVGFAVNAGFNATATGLADGASNVTISNNKIGMVMQTNTFSAVGIGLGNVVSGTNVITNNMVSGVMCNGTAGDVASGIQLGGGAGAVRVDYNTVAMQGAIQGATAGTQTSAAFAMSANAPMTTLTLQDNIFHNNQQPNTGGTTRIAAVALGHGSPYTGMVSNYNDLNVDSLAPGTYTVGITGGVVAGTARTTLAAWQAQTSLDANSVSVTPSFVSASDLHLTAGGNTALSNSGTPTATLQDYDCDNRSNTPDIGADEFFAACITAQVGNLLPGDSSSCAADSIILSASSYSVGIGSSYNWESSPFGQNLWSPVVGANDPDYFSTGTVTVPMEYRLIVSCATDTSAAISDTLSFYVGDSLSPSALCQSQSVTLDSTGFAVVPASNYDNGSTDNCTAQNALLYSTGQDTLGCGDVGTVNIVLTVTDLSGNSSTCSTTLTVAAQALSSSISSPVLVNGQNVSCTGGSDGSATVTPIGGCPSYTYLWSNNQVTATATGLAAGTYTVTVTDAGGQTSTQSITLTEPAVMLTCIGNSTQESCVPGNDGTATVAASGGSPGYTYLWNTTGSTPTITGLAAGTYLVTVTDIAGCTSVTTVIVSGSTPPAAPTISQSGNTLTCSTAGMSYQWFLNGNPIPGATGQTTTVTGPGTYTVTITDANGCSASSGSFVGVDPGIWAQNILLWPNPAHESAVLRSDYAGVELTDLRIMDLQGRVLVEMADQDLGAGIALDLKGLAVGTYLIELQQGELRATKRLVIQ